jgi:hypothetical protein
VVSIKLGMTAGISKLSLMHIKWVLTINEKKKQRNLWEIGK